ncbi:unnamed protein product [Rotaria socialis]
MLYTDKNLMKVCLSRNSPLCLMVTGIMKDNIRLELDRAGKLDDLEQKSDMLNEGSRQFAIHAQKLKKKYWWKNCRMWVILIGIIVIIIVIIVVAVVIKSKKK